MSMQIMYSVPRPICLMYYRVEELKMLIRKVTPDSHCHVFPARKYECSCLLPYCEDSDTPGTADVPLAATGGRFSLPGVPETVTPGRHKFM